MFTGHFDFMIPFRTPHHHKESFVFFFLIPRKTFSGVASGLERISFLEKLGLFSQRETAIIQLLVN